MVNVQWRSVRAAELEHRNRNRRGWSKRHTPNCHIDCGQRGAASWRRSRLKRSRCCTLKASGDATRDAGDDGGTTPGTADLRHEPGRRTRTARILGDDSCAPSRRKSESGGSTESPSTWTAHAAARACVSDPENARQAAREIMELIEGFHERGMSELQRRVQRLTRSASDFAAALESVRRHGSSRAMRGETKMQAADVAAVVRTSGRTSGSERERG